MATCANCIHHSLCDYNTNISGNGKVRLVYAEGADVKCSFFQNTADVVPKSEVAREFIEIINDRIDNIRARIPYGGRAQGKTLAVGKMRLLESLKVEIAKKYTEERE